MSPDDRNPSATVTYLRERLLEGRGPGASEREVAAHTRDRPLLQAVRTPPERLRRPRQTEDRRDERAGSTDAGVDRRVYPWRPALLGAIGGLLARSVAVRVLRPGRRRARDASQ